MGVLPGDNSSGAFDINNKREVVGYSYGARFRGILWSPSTGLQAIGPAPGFTDASLAAVNDSSFAVGEMTSGSRKGAMVWSPTLGSLDMNSLLLPGTTGWVLESAYDVNENGDVVGRGLYHGAPCSFYARAVPEPSLAVVATGLLLAFRRRRWIPGR